MESSSKEIDSGFALSRLHPNMLVAIRSYMINKSLVWSVVQRRKFICFSSLCSPLCWTKKVSYRCGTKCLSDQFSSRQWQLVLGLEWGGRAASGGWNQQCSSSEEEIIKPVEDIDEEEGRRESGASVAIDVVWVFNGEDGCSPAGRLLHRRQAAALTCHLLFWDSTVPSVTVRCLLRGLICSGADLHRLVWLGGGDDGDGAVSIGFIELLQKILIHGWWDDVSTQLHTKCMTKF